MQSLVCLSGCSAIIIGLNATLQTINATMQYTDSSTIFCLGFYGKFVNVISKTNTAFPKPNFAEVPKAAQPYVSISCTESHPKSAKLNELEWEESQKYAVSKETKTFWCWNAWPRITKPNFEAANLHIIILQNCNLCSFLLHHHITFLYLYPHEAITPGYSCSCTQSHSKSAKNYGKLRDKNFTSEYSAYL
jgi:hypothetical protein